MTSSATCGRLQIAILSRYSDIFKSRFLDDHPTNFQSVYRFENSLKAFIIWYAFCELFLRFGKGCSNHRVMLNGVAFRSAPFGGLYYFYFFKNTNQFPNKYSKFFASFHDLVDGVNIEWITTCLQHKKVRLASDMYEQCWK